MNAENSTRRNLCVAIALPSHGGTLGGWISDDTAVDGGFRPVDPLLGYPWANGLTLHRGGKKNNNFKHELIFSSIRRTWRLDLHGSSVYIYIYSTHSCDVPGCSPGCQNCNKSKESDGLSIIAVGRRSEGGSGKQATGGGETTSYEMRTYTRGSVRWERLCTHRRGRRARWIRRQAGQSLGVYGCDRCWRRHDLRTGHCRHGLQRLLLGRVLRGYHLQPHNTRYTLPLTHLNTQ